MTRAPLAGIVQAEAAKLARQPSAYVMLGILVGYVALFVFALASVLAAPPMEGFDPQQLLGPIRADAVGFVSDLVTSIALLVLVVLTAQVVGPEFSRGTLRTLLLARARRLDVAWGKLILLAFVVAGLALVVLVAGVAGAAAFGAVLGEPLLHVTAGGLALRAVRTFAALAAWALLAFGMTLLIRNTGVAIGATLGALLVGDVLRSLLASLGTAGTWAGRALPNAAIAALSSSKGLAATDWAWVLPNLLLYVVGLNAWALWKLQRLDVIAATK